MTLSASITPSDALTLEQRIELFRKLVRQHDITYDYSDDGSVWRAGSAAHTRILQLRETIPDAIACEIWNARMDAYFIPEEAPRWHWTVKTEETKNV